MAHHLLSGPLTLAPPVLAVATVLPLVFGDLLPCMHVGRTGCGFDLRDWPGRALTGRGTSLPCPHASILPYRLVVVSNQVCVPSV